MPSLLKTVGSSYLIKREDPDRWKGYFEHLTTVRTVLKPFRDGAELFRWLKRVTMKLKPSKRIKIGDHIMITRSQAPGEDVGFHMILRGRVALGDFEFYDRCQGSGGHKGKAIPGLGWRSQPYYQKEVVTNRFIPNPPSAGSPFTPRFRKERSFL